MKIVSKQQAIEITNGKGCTVTAYPLDEPKLDMAVATITGRYPDDNRVMNVACQELAYVFEGEGQLILEHKTYPLSQGDVVLIEAGEKYYWEGHMTLFISCHPAWTPEQHQHVI